jgi:hypothetical protein
MTVQTEGVRLTVEGQNQFLSAMNKAQGAVNGVSQAADKSEKPMKSMTAGSTALAVALGAALYQGALRATQAVIGFAKESVTAASNLNETTTKTQVVFGKMSDSVIAFSKTAAKSLGMSEQAAMAAAATYGNLFRSMGLTENASSKMSIELVKLAGDLASFNNLTPEEVLDKLRAGLVGEAEPLKTLGININEAVLKTKALELGLYDGIGALTASAKAQAAYAVMLEQSTLAQGDFARTSEGLANQQRIAKARLEDLKATLGTAVLPIVTAAVKAFNTLTETPFFKDAISSITLKLKKFADEVPNIVAGVVNTFKWMQDNIETLKTVAEIAFVGMGIAAGIWATRTVASIVSVAVAAGGSVIGSLKGLGAAFSLMQGAKTAGAALGVAGAGAVGLTAVLIPLAIAIGGVVWAWNKFIPKGIPAAIDATIVSHREHMLEVADSYREFAIEMIRANYVAQKIPGGLHSMAKALLEGKLNAEDEAAAIVELMQTMDDYSESTFTGKKAQQGLNKMVEEGIPYFGYLGDMMTESGKAAIIAADNAEDLAAQEKAVADEANRAATAIASMTAANNGSLSLVLQISNLNQDYADNLADLHKKGVDAADALAQLNQEGIKSGPAFDAATQAYNDNQAAIEELATAYEQAMKKIAWELFVEKLKSGTEGFTDAEYALAIQAGITAGVIDEKSAAMALSMEEDAAAAILASELMAAQIAVNWASLDGESITLTTIYQSQGTPPVAGSWQDFSDWTPPPPGGANGGLFPANKPAIVGEKGWEMIIPNTNSLVISHADIMGALAQATLAPSFSSISAPSSYSHTVNNNFNLSLATNQSPQVVQNSFALMRVLVG